MKILAALIVGLAIGFSAQAFAAPKAEPTHRSLARQLASVNRQLNTLSANVRTGRRETRTQQQLMLSELQQTHGQTSAIDPRTVVTLDVLLRLCRAHFFPITC